MAARYPNQGELIALELLVNARAAEDVQLRLFKNDVESGLSDAQKEALTESSFTVADFTGYANVTLIGDEGGASNDWTSTGGAPSDVSHAEVVFASTANQTAQTIFGWYLVGSVSGDIICYDYLATPVVIQNDGDQVRVTPKLTAKDTLD